MKASIFNIQKFSIHDGPGIRTTVFFKGCPLQCIWCHNPESQNLGKEILYDKNKCTLCGSCIKICQNNAIELKDNDLEINMDKCTFCGDCTVCCINSAKQIAGKEYTVDEVMKEVLKDRVFYKNSKGGVTLSGGEPLIYAAFVEELLMELKKENIHTAVDTCGAVDFKVLERISKYTDLFLYDIKSMDEEKHILYTGVSNKNIINNLINLSKIHNNINLRLPIIEGINADENHIFEILKLIKNTNIKKINLLPYHDIAMHKYEKLGRKYYEYMKRPADEKLKRYIDIIEKEGYRVKIGG
ncbi:MAG TPA: glycyl-radical enzyme activating protein [Sedimentibacter sp.]|jgi:pyruvate formate lyase activating enzyme|nr:glycyl-radical enzyme activating protein [Sedimentibacter sp.]HOG63519.1 glycyl-radical enzyme activating protein [Sedimentibacter sp.]HPB79223.1 glycyl-radical enzyme activating protein [Sedimentibacter sp.]HPV85614.1 glycyl-radical enzyme activating protein [Sedimentibacter sp.]HPY56797.1 glycyl-radical enzyme activating protein [Sedimentibacter sp.]